MQKSRPLRKASIRKVYNKSVRGNGTVDSNGWTMNVSGFKIYAFTLDYYHGKPSWSGSYWDNIEQCYFFDNRPVEKNAIDLDGNVYDLASGDILFNILKTN